MVSELTPNNVTIDKLMPVTTPDDKRLPLLPPTGITLLDCLSSLPRMGTFLRGHNINPDIIRAKAKASFRQQDNWNSVEIIIQPSIDDKLNEFLSNLKFNSNYVDHVDYRDFGNGGIIYLHGIHGH
jgi:hypothetical protein